MAEAMVEFLMIIVCIARVHMCDVHLSELGMCSHVLHVWHVFTFMVLLCLC